jgi:SAM-dependent methyltransferase
MMTPPQTHTGSEYDEYVRAEWQLFHHNPSRAAASLEALGTTQVSRVLDVGCGAGQELLPFVRAGRVTAIGVDYAEEAGVAGRELFASIGLADRVKFLRGSAEALPCGSGIFDVVVCRLALPYTDNARALSEFARVLRPGGLLLLKIHHARFYLEKLGVGLSAANFRSMAHAVRVLIAGSIYGLTGSQRRNRILGRESFTTERLLRRELASLGLTIRRSLPDHNARTPSFLIAKDLQATLHASRR